jgi:hypothetical protein
MTENVDRREGRGRLSAIELMLGEHPDAEADVIWANEQLRERKLPQVVILVGLNDRLVAKGIPPISKSSFSRYAVRKAILFRRHDEARRMSAELVAQLGPEGADEITVAIAETIKVAMQELLERGEMDSKSLMELGRSLSSVVNAQKTSAEHRKKLQEEVDQRMKKAAAAVAEAGAKGGIGEETLKKITSLLTTGVA